MLVHAFKHAEWSTQDVIDKYLIPINMEHMAKAFQENNINGAVLLALEVSLNSMLSVEYYWLFYR